MGYQIQRLTFGGILDQSFRLMRDHFVTLTAGMMAVFVPFGVLQYAAKGAAATAPGASGAFSLAAVLLLFAVFMPFAQLMVTVALADCYLGKPIDVATSARKALSHFKAYFGTNLLAGLATLGLMMLFVLPGLYFAICWALIGPVMVVEHVYGRAALKRSRTLVTGYFGRTLGVMFVAGILVGAVAWGLEVVFSMIPWLGAALSGAVSATTNTYMSATMVVLYIDLRARHENFDLQLMAAQVAAIGGQPSNAQPGDRNAPAA
jgi:hypothetical protein